VGITLLRERMVLSSRSQGELPVWEGLLVVARVDWTIHIWTGCGSSLRVPGGAAIEKEASSVLGWTYWGVDDD
jgi:hypothetical protein